MNCQTSNTNFPSITRGADAFVDRPLAQLFGADRLEAARRHLQECFAGLTATDESSRPGRHQFWTRYLPITSSAGAIEEALIVNLEVADREQTHEALRRSEASFSSAFDNSPIGMAIIAPDRSLLARKRRALRPHRAVAGGIAPRVVAGPDGP